MERTRHVPGGVVSKEQGHYSGIHCGPIRRDIIGCMVQCFEIIAADWLADECTLQVHVEGDVHSMTDVCVTLSCSSFASSLFHVGLVNIRTIFLKE